MKNNLKYYKKLLIVCRRIQINDELDRKANQIYGDGGLSKMKIKSLFRKGKLI